MSGTRAKAEEIFYQKIEDLTKTNDPSKDKAFTRWICQEYFPGLEDEMDIDEAIISNVILCGVIFIPRLYKLN